MSVEWSVARVRAVPLGVGVVGQARERRQQHRHDRREQDDVGRRRLAEQVEDHGAEQQPDREVGRGGVERVAQPAAVAAGP